MQKVWRAGEKGEMNGKGPSGEGGEVLTNQARVEVVVKVLGLEEKESKKIGQDLDHRLLPISGVSGQQKGTISGSETGHLEENVRKVRKPNKGVGHSQTLTTIGLRSKAPRYQDLMSAFVIGKFHETEPLWKVLDGRKIWIS